MSESFDHDLNSLRQLHSQGYGVLVSFQFVQTLQEGVEAEQHASMVLRKGYLKTQSDLLHIEFRTVRGVHFAQSDLSLHSFWSLRGRRNPRNANGEPKYIIETSEQHEEFYLECEEIYCCEHHVDKVDRPAE